jgi:hypothetical protein
MAEREEARMTDDVRPSVPAEKLGEVVTDWHQAALRVGEELASVGPDGYYGFTPEQWRVWALAALGAASARETGGLMEKIQRYRTYIAHHAKGATGATFQNNPNYNPADLCESQLRAIDQLLEYLDPKADSYLVSLVEYYTSLPAAPPAGQETDR